jgi:acetyl esterase/lipase
MFVSRAQKGAGFAVAVTLVIAGALLSSAAPAQLSEPSYSPRASDEPSNVPTNLALARAALPAASQPAARQPAAAAPTTVPPTAPALPAPTPTPAANPARIVKNVAFTTSVGCGSRMCQVRLDVYRPAGPGPFPEVVLVRGGPSGLGGRTGLYTFAREISAAGYVVFNADMRDKASIGGGYPAAFQDVACAIRYARANAAEFDGDAGSVTLVGHSLGGFVGSVVALDEDELGANCVVGGSGRPDAFVGLAGNYDLAAPEVTRDLGVFFGGTPKKTTAARTSSDPFGYANGAPIPIRLVAGTADGTVNPSASRAMLAFLSGRDWDVDLDLVPGAAHTSLIRYFDAGPRSLKAISEAVAAARVHAREHLPAK